MLLSRPCPVRGAAVVTVALTPPDRRRTRDCDNYVKPILDQLVRCGVIADDSSEFVREVRALWAAGEVGAQITIEPVPA